MRDIKNTGKRASKNTGKMLSGALMGAALLLTPCIALASGDDHGHVTPASLFSNIEFWGAVVNFTLLVILLRKVLGNPLSSHLTERRRAVEEGMKEAAALKAEAEKVYQEYSQRLETMDADIEKLREDIVKAAEADKERLLSDAKASSERMHAETQSLIAQHAEALSREIRAEVVEAAVKAAEEVLRGQVNADDQKRLAEQFRASVAARGGQA